MSAGSVSLLVVGAGHNTVLGLNDETVIVPAGSGCGVTTEGGSADWPAAVEGRAGILGDSRLTRLVLSRV